MNDLDSTDFLEDLSNLSNDLKHPSEKAAKIDEINIDDLITETVDVDPTETVSDIVPAKKEQPEPISQQPQQTEQIDLSNSTENPTEIQNYVLKQCQDIILQGKETLEQLQDTVINTCDGKAINGYATLVASLSKVLDTANSIGMEKSRIKSSIEMENLKHQHKAQIKTSGPATTQNTVNIVAGREEVMKMLSKMGESN